MSPIGLDTSPNPEYLIPEPIALSPRSTGFTLGIVYAVGSLRGTHTERGPFPAPSAW